MWWTPNATTLYQADGTYSNHGRLHSPPRLFAKNNVASNPSYRLRVRNMELERDLSGLERDLSGLERDLRLGVERPS